MGIKSSWNEETAERARPSPGRKGAVGERQEGPELGLDAAGARGGRAEGLRAPGRESRGLRACGGLQNSGLLNSFDLL